MNTLMNLHLFGEDAQEPLPIGESEEMAPAPSEETAAVESELSSDTANTAAGGEESDGTVSETVLRKIYAHMAKLEEESEPLRQRFPGFDLREELKNPVFARLTAPDSGISAEDAYFAVHRREILAWQAPSVPESPAGRPRRPSENGIAARAPTVTEFDYRHASREQREALKKAIRTAAANGKKIYPG